MVPENNILERAEKKHLSFIRTFIGTCCGTQVFVVLSRHSLWRVLAHLLLLALLISVPVTVMISKRCAPEFSAAREIFVSTFGSDVYFNTESLGLSPIKEPEKARTAVFPGFGRIFYYPVAPEKLPDSSSYADLGCFAVWSPGNLSIAYRGSDNQWMVNTFNRSGISFSISSRPEELFNVVQAQAGGKTVKFSSERIFNEIFFAYRVRCYIAHAVAIFVLPLIYSLLLLAVLKFTFARVAPPDYFAWWKCGVYAAFPGALIASAVPAFDLPLLSFSTAYMLSTMIYGLHAVMRVEYEKTMISEENNNGKSGEE